MKIKEHSRATFFHVIRTSKTKIRKAVYGNGFREVEESSSSSSSSSRLY